MHIHTSDSRQKIHDDVLVLCVGGDVPLAPGADAHAVDDGALGLSEAASRAACPSVAAVA